MGHAGTRIPSTRGTSAPKGWLWRRKKKKRHIPEVPLIYEDITKQQLGVSLVPGKHPSVNINDSVMWKGAKLGSLQNDPASQEEYRVRKQCLLQTMGASFPLFMHSLPQSLHSSENQHQHYAFSATNESAGGGDPCAAVPATARYRT